MVDGIADLSILGSSAELGVRPLQLTGMDTDLLFRAAKTRAETFTNWQTTSAGSP